MKYLWISYCNVAPNPVQIGRMTTTTTTCPHPTPIHSFKTLFNTHCFDNTHYHLLSYNIPKICTIFKIIYEIMPARLPNQTPFILCSVFKPHFRPFSTHRKSWQSIKLVHCTSQMRTHPSHSKQSSWWIDHQACQGCTNEYQHKCSWHQRPPTWCCRHRQPHMGC